MTNKTQIEAWIYQQVLKPFFFLLDAETVHTLLMNLGESLGSFAVGRQLLALLFGPATMNNSFKKDGIEWPGRVGLAAGFDYNAQLTQTLPNLGFGFSTVGTVTYKAYEGNPKPRLGRLPKSQALLVNKGFKNVGAREIIRRLTGKQFAIPIGISIGSTNTFFESLDQQISDIIRSFRLFERSKLKHSYYELNISCPNTKGGQPFTTKERLEKLLRAVKKLHISRPIYVKMPIDYSKKETLVLLHVIDKYPIQGVIFGNLTKDKNNPDVNPEDRIVWQQRAGNVSGKPTWSRSNEKIALTKKRFKDRFTIIGTGGIFSGQDAVEKIRLGADLVQLISGMVFQGPQLITEINQSLQAVDELS